MLRPVQKLLIALCRQTLLRLRQEQQGIIFQTYQNLRVRLLPIQTQGLTLIPIIQPQGQITTQVIPGVPPIITNVQVLTVTTEAAIIIPGITATMPAGLHIAGKVAVIIVTHNVFTRTTMPAVVKEATAVQAEADIAAPVTVVPDAVAEAPVVRAADLAVADVQAAAAVEEDTPAVAVAVDTDNSIPGDFNANNLNLKK
jgi:hypothetical protein